MNNKRPTPQMLLVPIAVTLAVTVGLMLLGRVGDVLTSDGDAGPFLLDWLSVENSDAARAIILSVLEVLAGVFAISITVVAIVVQLSATRYTSRVVDLFLADPFNILVFFAYVVPLIYGFWLVNALVPEASFKFSLGLFMAVVTLSTILVIPYFRFVFYFLQPGHIIETIEHSIRSSLEEAITRPKRMMQARENISNSIRQLSDIAVASIGQADILLAMQCTGSVREAAVHYQAHKHRLPDAWFNVDRNYIAGLSEDMWQAMLEQRTWLEMDVFKQYELAFTSSLGKVRDINSQVARGLREIAEAASEQGRDETLELMIKAFNTFINYALSARDIRSCVHVLYQYRLLGERVLHRPEVMGRIGTHLMYYGHSSQRRGIFFVLDAVAFDMRVLIERSLGTHPETMGVLLDLFMALERSRGLREEAGFLRAVRKSQALLAAFFLMRGEQDLAHRIAEELKAEAPEFLESICQEMLSVQSREFWEIEDRGVSLYYVEEERRAPLVAFFASLHNSTQHSSKPAAPRKRA